MARACDELLSMAHEPMSPQVDFLLAETLLRYPDDADDCASPVPLAAGLLSFQPTAIEHARLRVIGASFMTGRSDVHALARTSWTRELLQVAALSVARDVDLVLALPDDAADVGTELAHLASLGGLRVAVTNDRAISKIAGVDGVVRAKRSTGETAASVFKIIATLIAPDLITCLDIEDLLQVFSVARPAEVVEAVWLAPGRLVFLSAEDQEMLESARCALLFFSALTVQQSREAKLVASAVRRHMRCASDLLVQESLGFLAPAWPSNGALPVSILCSR